MILPRLSGFAILFNLCLLAACSGPINSEHTIDESEIELSQDLLDFTKSNYLTVVLTKKGCSTCNKTLVHLADSLLKTKDIAVVVETTGRMYDISEMLKEEYKPKVHFDYKSQLSKKYNAENSYFLYHPNGIEGNDVLREEITVNNLFEFKSSLIKHSELVTEK